jgi:hypothetical protein
MKLEINENNVGNFKYYITKALRLHKNLLVNAV